MGKYLKKKKTSNPLIRGLAAVVAAAGVLTAIVLATHPGSQTPPDETTEPTIITEPPIPANPFGPEDFVYEGEYLSCTAADAALGVDVSEYQGQIDWTQVGQSGMEFAFVRIGYRGYTSGGLYEDAHALENLRGAREAGLKVGAYFYSQAISPEEAIAEAQFCIAFLEDQSIDLPVVYDWEYVSADARTGAMDSQTLTACAKAFCDTLENAGYDSMIYFNPTLADSLLELEQLLEYPWWLAMYTSRMDYPHRVELWQYTQNGNVPGITGDTDVNLWFTYDG